MNPDFLKKGPLCSGRFLAVTLAAMIVCSGLAQAQRIELPASDGIQVTPNTNLNAAQLAARFLDQATAGATPEEVTSLASALAAHPDTAFSDWINDQFARPLQPGDLAFNLFHASYDAEVAKVAKPDPANPPNPLKGYGVPQALRGSLMIGDRTHELRRMVAYSLSQIFVVGDIGSDLTAQSEAMCDYYDMLNKDAFTDFSTILTDVTFHPAMSLYLSSSGNAKAGFFNKNSRPDENYAREVMQLFTIGLIQLNEDGSIVVDASGHAIPTYGQPDVTEIARIFTGLKIPVGMINVYGEDKNGNATMALKRMLMIYGRDEIDEGRHDTGAKTFLGTSLPVGQDTTKDIGDFLQILCKHPNTAPFFARGMIQHMVTSNPSPAYIKRVADAFKASNCDMKAVVRAILLDEEARNPAYAKQNLYGKLHEPWLRFTELARGFNAQSQLMQPTYAVNGRISLMNLGQYPLSSSSVFNFYLPNYQPPGPIAELNKTASESTTLITAPEFQIMNSNTALLTPNYLMSLIYGSSPAYKPNTGMFNLDLTPQINLAGDPAALVDNISTLLTGGTMSDRTRGIIIHAVDQINPAGDPAVLKERARMAVYLTMVSPDYAIQK